MSKRKRKSKGKARRTSHLCTCTCRKGNQAPTSEWTPEREQALRELSKKLIKTSTLIY